MAVNVSTAPPWAVMPPNIVGAPSVAAAGEDALSLTFGVDGPGLVHYLVVYGNMYARFMDAYVVFDNQARA